MENDSLGPARTAAPWWQEALFYQIYPRSFMDSDGDGVGDLRGILSRLDYISSLGVDAIWLNPIFASPNADNGYDVSDYRRIMPELGTMEDFDALLQGVHERGMRLVLDMVFNHSSDEHAWFAAARTSRSNPYYHYYHWWPAERGTPPVRESFFDEKGNAWRYNEATDSWYLHYFSRQQPDLNWENPRVRVELHAIMRFWLERGVDGFRMDAIPYISKDDSFPPFDPARYASFPDMYSRGPCLHDYLREMRRRVLAPYGAFAVGEGSAVTADRLRDFIDPAREELDMLYSFGAAEVRNYSAPDSPRSGIPYSLRALKAMFAAWNAAAGQGWPAVYLGNHDQPRITSRFGSEEEGLRELSAKMLATFLLTMRGTPFWYAGDELGMVNIRFNRIGDYDDIETRNHYQLVRREGGDVRAFLEEQKQVGRDNARTPFQWSAAPRAGFTTGRPWLRVNPDYRRVNARAQERDPASVLNYFRRMAALRRASAVLRRGDYTPLDAASEHVFAYRRFWQGERVLVALNFTPLRAPFSAGVDLRDARPLIHNYAEPSLAARAGRIELRPFEAIVWSY